MSAMNQIETIKDILSQMDKTSLLEYWNDFCEKQGCTDEIIFENTEDNINHEYSGSVMDALCAAANGHYSVRDEFFILDGYRQLESFGKADIEDYVDFDRLADFAMQYGCAEISEVWYDDMVESFIYFYNEKMKNVDYLDYFESDDYDLVYNYDLVMGDWDDICYEIAEERKEKKNNPED